MIPDTLHAWMEGRHAGMFTRTGDGVMFEYDPDFHQPVSLSMPRGGGWARRTPGRFLDNLLPDDPAVRRIMADSTGATSTDTFDLLDHADASGGLVFTRSDTPPDRNGTPMLLAEEPAIAARIVTLQHSPGAWWDTGVKIRFSLAGSQPKFTLGYRDGDWYWPDADHPSTHILKPSDGRNPHVEQVETASMRLCMLCGIPTPDNGLIRFQDRTVYMVERYDRAHDKEGNIIRIHTEDMLQALGLPSERKYTVKPRQILTLLHRVDETDLLSYQWIRRFALNTSISNVDAHAKNYSIILRPNGVGLSPMYDVLTTTFWPYVDRSLPMEIGGVRGARQLTPRHWRRLAVDNRLDADKVEKIARNTAWLVLEHADEAYRDLPADMKTRLERELESANRNMEPEPPEHMPEPAPYRPPEEERESSILP